MHRNFGLSLKSLKIRCNPMKFQKVTIMEFRFKKVT